jgi:hypothetical protein
MAATSLSLLAVIAPLAHADETIPVFVRGAGNDSCGKYLSATTGQAPGKGKEIDWQGHRFVDQSIVYQEWVAGFLTTVNIRLDDAHQIKTDPAGTDLWFRHWCNAHPTKSLFDASLAFANEQTASH